MIKSLLRNIAKRIRGIEVDTNTDSVSVSNNSFTEITRFTVPSGIWMINVAVQFDTNATGIRRVQLASTSGGSYGIRASANYNAVSGTQTIVHIPYPIVLSAERTFVVNALQNSGASLYATARIASVGIKL